MARVVDPDMTPIQLTRSVRGLNRLRQIAQVLTRHGFGHIVAQINLSRYLPVWMRRKPLAESRRDDGASSLGRRLSRVCAELGPTFVKLGQMLSTRPDIVPDDVLGELKTLQDDVAPFDTGEAMEIVRQELGRPASECFAWIDDVPMASASIGQVYRARGKDGTNLVVKIRRPDIDTTIALDMQLLRWLAESVETYMPELSMYRPTMLVDELDQALTRELDYINEASATSRFAEGLGGDEGIRIPAVNWELTGRRVLTLEALDGVSVRTLLSGSDPNTTGIDRRLVARRLAQSYLKQIFELTAFHADPHPGNILITPPGNIGLIDFGQVGAITDRMMTDLVVLIYAYVNGEMELAVETLADMGAVGKNTDTRSLQRALKILIDKYRALPIKRFDLGTLLAEASEINRRHDIAIPRELAMLFKAVGMVGAVVAELDPDLNLLELIKPRIRKALSERFSPRSVARSATLAGWDALSIVRNAPRQLRRAIRRLSSGNWELNVRHENLDRLIRELDRSGNRIAFSLVLAAIIVGSSLVFSSPTDLTLFGMRVQYFGVAGFLMAGILGLGLSWAIIRSGRPH